MCGIAGFVGQGGLADLHRMMQALVHRGPDGEGSYCDGQNAVFLGHRRLAVIDPATGAQPMWNGQKTVGVVFNGEIYNHAELRRQLEGRGHRFRSDHSDTEVLVHGYAEWGEALPEHLNGMFAFCIYDHTRGRLFLARDRFGEKPLYYSQQNGVFVFASELAAITRHGSVSTRFSRRGMQKLLAYGFLPAPNTILENCQKLPGGCTLTFDVRTRALCTRRYWQFRLTPEPAWLDRDEDDLAEELRAHLFEAVRRRLAADVPMGFFLSGGIDSGAMLAAATRYLPKETLRSFTLGFREPSFDESKPAKLMADALGVGNEVDWLDLDKARAEVPGLLAQLDEPSCDASILPTYLLSRFTRKHVTVAISGDGGDELFAGYDPFAALAPARLYKAFVPRPFHDLLREAIGRLPVSAKNMSLDFKLRRTLQGLSFDEALWNPVWLAPAEPGLIRDVFEEPLTPEELYSEALQLWDERGNQPLIDHSLEFYTNFYLPDGIFNKVDRASMLCSLETRAPFVDIDLAEFCRQLPHQLKMKKGRRKYLLRKALDGVLPQEIIERKKKGFGIPAATWLKSMPPSPPLASVPGVRMETISSAWRDHRRGEADHRLLLWSWLSLQSLDYFGRASAPDPVPGPRPAAAEPLIEA